MDSVKIKHPFLVVCDPNLLLEFSSVGNMGLMLYGSSAPDNSLLYLACDSETHEIQIRRYGYARPGDCKVYGTSQPLCRFLNTSSVKEIYVQILDNSEDFPDWCKRRDSSSLSTKEALEIAKLARNYLTGSALIAEQETLRLRCRMGPFDWNSLMSALEIEFNQELERRGLTVNPVTNASHPTAKKQKIDFNSIRTKYLDLLSRAVSQSEVELFKIQTRQIYPLLQPSELNRFLDATENEFNKTESLLNDAEELQKLIDASEQTINLADYLPPSLAQPLTQYCEWQKIRPAVVLLCLLTSMSSLHKVGTELVLHKNLNFTVPPTLYSAIVAESGSKKSPIFRAMAKLPLNTMKKSRQDEYLENLKDYQSDLEAWEEEKSNLKKGEKPTIQKPTEPQKAPIFYFTDATGEGIKAQAQAAPDKALFALVDELAGYFGSQNAYRGGKGSDKQDILSYYDGTGATVSRASGVKIDIDKIYLSILGTIQPDVIKKIMGNTNDVDGFLARFLIVFQPNIPTTLPEDVPGGVDCTEVITTYFEKVFKLPATICGLSREAFKIYQPFYNRLEQLRVSHPNLGMRAVYAKAEGLTGRLALNLHYLHELAEGRTPSEKIGVEVMEKAISLMKFFIGQVRLLHAGVNDGDTVAPHVHKVIELSKRKQLCGEEGWIKASDIQKNTTRAKRPSAAEAREWMSQALNLGYGVVRGEGTKIEFKSLLQNSIDKNRQNRQTIDTVSIPENVDIQGIQKTIDKIDEIDDHQKMQSSLEELTQPIIKRQEIDNPRLFCLSNLESIDLQGNSAIDNSSIFASPDCLSSISEKGESAKMADIVDGNDTPAPSNSCESETQIQNNSATPQHEPIKEAKTEIDELVVLLRLGIESGDLELAKKTIEDVAMRDGLPVAKDLSKTAFEFLNQGERDTLKFLGLKVR